MDTSLLKQMRKNSVKDLKKADNLLKGTADLKKQLEELSSLATWNDSGDIVISPPECEEVEPTNLNRSQSDYNHLTVQISDNDVYTREFVEKVRTVTRSETLRCENVISMFEIRLNEE